MSMHKIKNDAAEVWFLVRVQRITDSGNGRDCTDVFLRDAIKEHHFGGDTAKVRRLKRDEIKALAAPTSPTPAQEGKP